MPGVPFSAYVIEHTTRGDAVFRRAHVRAVLVHQEGGLEAEERGFDTKHMRRDGLRQTLAATMELPSVATLTQRTEPRLGQVHRIEKRPGGVFPDRIGLGRAPNADISIPLPRISKYHAYLTASADGASHTLTDAGSTNGTQVNDHRLSPKDAHPLESGDIVRLGPYAFVYLSAAGLADWAAKRRG